MVSLGPQNNKASVNFPNFLLEPQQQSMAPKGLARSTLATSQQFWSDGDSSQFCLPLPPSGFLWGQGPEGRIPFGTGGGSGKSL